jgi:hypothetical protein
MRAYGQFQEECVSVRSSARGRSDTAIFSQDWWLKIARVSPGYRELKVSNGRDVVGRLPLVLSKGRLGIVRGHDPYWSHLGGPIVDPKMDRSAQAKVIRGLLEQLPSRISLSFVCDPGLSYADLVRDAFTDAGFAHSTQVTYLRFPSDGDLLSTRKSKHRGHFKRAAKSLDCIDIQGAEFVQFFETNLRARNKRSYAPLGTLTNLLEEAIGRGNGRAIAARPRSLGSMQKDCLPLSYPHDAAIAYIWDADRCYYWLSTTRADYGTSQAKPHPDAIKLLALRAMEHAQAMGLIFDADGVATPGADHLYRDIFGLQIEQRRDIFERVNILDRLYTKCREEFRSIASRSKRQVAIPQAQPEKMFEDEGE